MTQSRNFVENSIAVNQKRITEHVYTHRSFGIHSSCFKIPEAEHASVTT
ncbi:MAG: hypothetical protein LBJ00_18785 [Planctomycetaceae bacterium]|nr:hypothetical protein [Planctomycetaceae bacterium]